MRNYTEKGWRHVTWRTRVSPTISCAREYLELAACRSGNDTWQDNWQEPGCWARTATAGALREHRAFANYDICSYAVNVCGWFATLEPLALCVTMPSIYLLELGSPRAFLCLSVSVCVCLSDTLSFSLHSAGQALSNRSQRPRAGAAGSPGPAAAQTQWAP